MKFRDLKKYIAEKPRDRIFLIEGDDAYLRGKAVSMLTAYIVSAYPEMNITPLNQPAPRDIAESMSVMPFMSEKRAVTVKEYYPSFSDIEELSSRGFDENPACALLIINSQKHPVYSKLQNRLCRVDCAREEPAVLRNWIKAILSSCGKEIDIAAAEKLAVYCGQDMMKIDNEIKKLSALGKNVIDGNDIEQNVSKDADYQAYMFASAAAEKKGNAYLIMKDFLSKGDTASSLILLSALNSSYRRMFFAKESRLSDEKLSEALGVKPYAVTMSKRAAARFKKSALKGAVNMLGDCEYSIKSGAMAADTAIYYIAARLLSQQE